MTAARYRAVSHSRKTTVMDVALLVAFLMVFCRAAAQPPAEILQALEAAQQAQHQVAAAYGPPNITAASVRRIAKASQPAEGGDSNAAGGTSSPDTGLDHRSSTATTMQPVLSGVEEAVAEGIQVDVQLLMQNPAAAAQVRNMCIASSLARAGKRDISTAACMCQPDLP